MPKVERAEGRAESNLGPLVLEATAITKGPWLFGYRTEVAYLGLTQWPWV